MSDKKVIAIIPARGGSKRFPGKNIHSLNGKPLLYYPIKAALDAKEIDRVIVSTDDQRIAEAAQACGAELPFFRPAELSGDASPVVEAMAYTVKRLNDDEGYRADYIVLLQPTTPFVSSEQVSNAVNLALEKDADSVVSVTRVDTASHPYNVRVVDDGGAMKFWQEELHYKDIGKKKPDFYKAANIWLTSYNTLLNDKRIEGKNNFALFVDCISGLDIDHKEDLELAEAWLQYKENNKQ